MTFDRNPQGYALDAAVERHHETHYKLGGDPLDLNDLVAAPALGSILVAQSAGAGRYTYQEYAVVVPAGAALRNAFVLDNGDTKPTYKPTLSTALPVVVTPAGAGAAGTSLLYSHVDHDHPATDVASAAILNAFAALFQSSSVVSAQQLTSNSTAFQNVTNMAIALGANQVWRFAMTIIFISSAAADFKWQFTVPAGATLFWSSPGQTYLGVPVNVYNQGAGVSGLADGSGAAIAVEIQGTVINGANAGNLQLQAAQNTATVEATDFVLIGSNYFARRV